MIFGLQGSKILVKVANTLINPVGEDGEVSSTFGGGKKKILPDAKKVGGYIESLGQGLKNTAMNSFAGGSDGEL